MKRRSLAFSVTSFGLAVALALLLVQGSACVDGTTPDCSDADTCGPPASNNEAGGEASSDSALQDTGNDTANVDTGAPDANGDAADAADAKDGDAD